MSHCLWCDQAITYQATWRHLLTLMERATLCEPCQTKLTLLTGKQCQKCSRESETDICLDCHYWIKELDTDPLTANISVFSYNEQMREMIAKWKYRGDYELVHAFRHVFVKMFNKHFSTQLKDFAVIPIPLSEMRLYERGFNQADALARLLPRYQPSILQRLHSEKQAKKSRYERIQSKNPFNLVETINKPVILVDDIYTTGTTLRHAATLLRRQGCPKVYGYTLVRG
ncbi:MAG TPA: ComF family protein [Cerasibacillus sp.]|uniref:ComF family protein n=1 Tax=Cerasibacillus sp. TaxID=2498711 RepID=UPI002F42E671